MSKFLPALALLAGACTINVPDEIDIDGIDTELPAEDFSRVVNETGNTLVLVGEDAWDWADNFWVFDCAEDVVSELDVSVDGDSLTIGSEDGTVREDCRVKVKADGRVDDVSSDGDGDLDSEGNVTGVKAIHVKGNGDLHLNQVTTESLHLEVEGSGEISVADLQADTLTLDLRGNGDATLAGDVDEGVFEITGNGDLFAKDLILQELLIDLSGNGDAVVTVEQSIAGSVTGSGTLSVHGSPDGEVSVDGEGAVSLVD
jgi:hypothetical protein